MATYLVHPILLARRELSISFDRILCKFSFSRNRNFRILLDSMFVAIAVLFLIHIHMHILRRMRKLRRIQNSIACVFSVACKIPSHANFSVGPEATDSPNLYTSGPRQPNQNGRLATILTTYNLQSSLCPRPELGATLSRTVFEAVRCLATLISGVLCLARRFVAESITNADTRFHSYDSHTFQHVGL